MHLDTEKIFHIRAILNNPTLNFSFSKRFGSANPTYKTALRDELIQALEGFRKLSNYEKIELQNIYKTPQLQGVYISISHTEDFGGFIISKTKAVGFDLEKKSRIKKEIIQRVCDDSEIKEALHMESLWGAKESAFKALQYFHQPAVISTVKIGSWSIDPESQIEIFSLQNNLDFAAPSGNGCVISDKDYIYSVFSF